MLTRADVLELPPLGSEFQPYIQIYLRIPQLNDHMAQPV
jgi:hypothetical protein